MIGYAETHFKFRLPWSPLSRPFPEMLIDAPSMALPGAPIPLTLAVHCAHRYPIRLKQTRVVVRGGGNIRHVVQVHDLLLDQPFHWIPLQWPEFDPESNLLVDAAIVVEDAKGKTHSFLNHNLPGLAPTSLSIQRLKNSFPFPRGWTSGDLHCHTTWSEDPVEWGGSPEVLREAADCMGMGFWAATDHSYDFAWEHPDYTEPTDPVARFREFRRTLPRDQPGRAVVLPAEEVSCGNGQGRNIHLIVIDHPDYIEGQGDGGRRWLANRPDLSIVQVLERTVREGSPALAAHPRPGIGLVERLLFRRGQWDLADLHPGIHGLQFWNGATGKDFMAGRSLWVHDLVRGGRRLPIAGNDAHGDLNRATYVKFPLLGLGAGNGHRFGQARTWLHLDEAPTRASLRRALAEGAPCVLSDGPGLSLKLPGARNAAERAVRAVVEGMSTTDFGKIDVLRVFAHRRGQAREEMILERKPSHEEARESFDLPAECAYARAELITAAGRRALTAAIEPG